VYPSDILPPSITRSATLIVNTYPHTANGTHWLALHLQPRFYSGYFCDSYGLPPRISSILTFLRRACSVCEYNTTQLQGWNSTVCGECCCLFALYMDRGYTPQQFEGLFNAATADRQISRLFASDFGPLHVTFRGCQGCTASIKGNYTTSAGSFRSCNSFDTHYGGCCRF
jgi:hypothetical protein